MYVFLVNLMRARCGIFIDNYKIHQIESKNNKSPDKFDKFPAPPVNSAQCQNEKIYDLIERNEINRAITSDNASIGHCMRIVCLFDVLYLFENTFQR